MIVSLIVAIGKNNQMGINNSLPWRLKDDLKNFKKVTEGHSVLMGRKTFESIGKPLPNRTNIIISRSANFSVEGCKVFNSVEDGISFAKDMNETELFIIGGREIYEYCLTGGIVDKLYLTKVDFDGKADTYFPEVDLFEWKILSSEQFQKSEKNEYNFLLEILCK
jgi:dihydrofolate reductase